MDSSYTINKMILLDRESGVNLPITMNALIFEGTKVLAKSSFLSWAAEPNCVVKISRKTD